MVKPTVLLVGNVEPQITAVAQFLHQSPLVKDEWCSGEGHPIAMHTDNAAPDLIIVAGYRRLIPPHVLAVPRYGTVGFHSARLPEYPGRAPIPWTLVRGDKLVWNTMLYLDEGVDSGDIIAAQCRPVTSSDTPDTLYQWVAQSCVSLLDIYLPSLLDGTAPRTPQDPAKRGRLTSKDGWNVYHELQRLGAGHG